MDFKKLQKINLKSGMTYYIKKGIYKDVKLTIKSVNPANITTIEGSNDVVLEGNINITLDSDKIRLSGFIFNNISKISNINIKSNNNIFTNNEITNIHKDNKNFITIEGEYNRIYKNTFNTIDNNNNLLLIRNKNNLIDNNTFNRVNCDSIIKLGDKKGNNQSKSIIYNNFISSCNSKTASIIINYCNNRLLYNKITSSKGNAVIIYSKDNNIKYNMITGNLTSGEYGGIKVYGCNNRIMNNTFDTLITIENYLSPITIMSNVEKIFIEKNDFIECYYCLTVGLKYKKKNNKKIIDFILRDNRLSKCRGFYLNDDKLLDFDISRGSIENNDILKTDMKLNIYTPSKLDKLDIEKFFINFFLKPVENKKEKVKDMIIKDKDDFIIEDVIEVKEEKQKDYEAIGRRGLPASSRCEAIGLGKFSEVIQKINDFNAKLLSFKETNEKQHKEITEMLKLLS